MNAILFDTLLVARTLRAKGFTPDQADGIAEAFGTATHAELATKADLATLRAELKTDIAELKGEIAGLRGEIGRFEGKIGGVEGQIGGLRGEIGAIKADILKWVVGAIGFQTVATLGTVIALVRIFAR